MMIHWLSKRIAAYCADGTDANREIVAYGLECRISDFVQIAVLTVTGLALDRMGETFCFCICFTVLKRQVGGCHCSTHFACIAAFTVLSIAVTKLVQHIPLEWSVYITLTGMAVVFGIVILRAPVAHPNHPKSRAAHQKSRRASLWLAVLGTVSRPMLAIPFPALGMAGAFGGLFAALSLVIPVKREGG